MMQSSKSVLKPLSFPVLPNIDLLIMPLGIKLIFYTPLLIDGHRLVKVMFPPLVAIPKGELTRQIKLRHQQGCWHQIRLTAAIEFNWVID